MAESQSIEDRLKSHAEAFNGLLSLIPAKVYYGADTSDQWQRKKQTKAEARAAKIAKLDPANNKSALDVIQENEKKRKRDEHGENTDETTATSGQGPKQSKPSKKQRTEPSATETLSPSDDEAIRAAKRDKRKQKREDKKVRKGEQQAKEQQKKELKQQKKAEAEDDEDEPEDAVEAGAVMEPLDMSGLAEEEEQEQDWESANSEQGKSDEEDDDQPSTETSSQKEDSPAFDFSAQPSGTSSISSTDITESMLPPKAKNTKPKAVDKSSTSESKSNPSTALSNSEQALSKEETAERIRRRLAELRAARKADVNGQPAKTRAELLDSRRKKQDSRKEKKKALRQQAKEEEEKKRNEAIARGSPLMSPSVRSPPPEEANNFSFGRVAFENGQTMTADLNDVLDLSKKKGPSDLKTAMLAANARNSRLAGLDAQKRADITEKDMWLTARKRVHGEKAKDDQSLLKKALKRKEKAKEKSSNDWNKRTEGVKLGKEARQKKRETNLAKRKEEKGKKGGSKGSKPKKQKKRPGFEGSFRAGGKR